MQCSQRLKKYSDPSGQAPRTPDIGGNAKTSDIAETDCKCLVNFLLYIANSYQKRLESHPLVAMPSVSLVDTLCMHGSNGQPQRHGKCVWFVKTSAHQFKQQHISLRGNICEQD
jgi:hypothetical protein